MRGETRGVDEVRFDDIYSRCALPLLAYLLRRLPVVDARDAAAETFLVVWRRLDDVPEVPLPWVLGVARRQVSNMVRGTNRRQALQDRLRADPPVPSAEAGLGGATGGDCASRLGMALAQLDEADVEVLLLVGWDGLQPRDAALVLGCSPGTFRVRLHRARRRLADELKRPLPPDDLRRSDDARR